VKVGVVVGAVILIVALAICLWPATPSNYIYEDGGILVGGDGEPIELINNPDATDHTFAELIAFVKEDPTDEHYYAGDFAVLFGTAEVSYVCSDFAEAMHNNAEAAGIRAAWVSIDFEGDDKGHALNAFETTDRGLVYIDCTGKGALTLRVPHDPYDLVKTEQGTSLMASDPTSWDKVAYVEIGKEYGLIPLDQAESPSYSFYEEYEQKQQEYEELVSDYNDEVTLYNQAVTSYEDASYGIPPPEAPDASEYGTSLEEEQRLFFDQLEWITEMLDWGLRKYGSKEQWLELADWAARLQEKEQLIAELGEGLGDFRFEPLGIVEDVSIYWGSS
jgi:hypothetical protein